MTDLLRPTLAYYLGKVDLRAIVAWPMASNIADISDVTPLGRLCNTGPWLRQLIGRILRSEQAIAGKDRLIRILDATTAGVQDKKNSGLWRVH